MSPERYGRKLSKAAVGVAIAAAIASTAAGGAQTNPAPPSYAQYSQSTFLPYAQPVDFQHLDHLLKVRARINGGPVTKFVVDTGSTGIVVGADDVPNVQPGGTPGVMHYSSSGVELLGVWTTAIVDFPDARGGAATAVVPVLVVNKEICTGKGINAAHCHPSDHPHPHMMGVGFGRGQVSHPERNPFLNLRPMAAGTMQRGYLITHAGIALGLTAKVVGGGYAWQKLEARESPSATGAASSSLKDWKTAPGGFEVEGFGRFSGTVLVDTGLTNMMLAAPAAPSQGDLPEGTEITVNLLGGQVHYSFRVGDEKNPQTPRRVTWVKPAHGVYINTGLRALAGYDYLFDDQDGWLALRPAR